jgi:hypothetical protein
MLGYLVADAIVGHKANYKMHVLEVEKEGAFRFAHRRYFNSLVFKSEKRLCGVVASG